MEDIFGEELYGVEDNEGTEQIEVEREGNANSADEAEEVPAKRIVKPKKPVLRPQPKLDPQRLSGPRGIGILEQIFQNVKLKGKGHEVADLNTIMSHLEYWAHRLFPKMTFDDCIDRIEDLGSKKAVVTYLTRLRLGMEEVAPEETERHFSPSPTDFDRLISEPSQPDPQPVPQEEPQPTPQPVITDEQRARMLQNRLIAEERRLARLKEQQQKTLVDPAE